MKYVLFIAFKNVGFVTAEVFRYAFYDFKVLEIFEVMEIPFLSFSSIS